MTEIKVTNLVKFFTICLLYERPKHGYELIKEIGRKLGLKVSPGQMYPFLNKLEKNKLVKSVKARARDKKVYRLTKEGNKFAEKMLNRFGDLIDLAIEPRLSVCTHCGCKIYEGGYKEKIKGRELVFCCNHCAESFKT